MKERAYGLNPATQDCLIATFHSILLFVFPCDADHIGYNRRLTIVDLVGVELLMKHSQTVELGSKNGMNEVFWVPFPMLRMT